MISSRRAFLVAALFAAVAPTLGAPAALASSQMHAPGPAEAVHGQEGLRFTTRHLPSSHQAQPRQPVEDPFADLILG